MIGHTDSDFCPTAMPSIPFNNNNTRRWTLTPHLAVRCKSSCSIKLAKSLQRLRIYDASSTNLDWQLAHLGTASMQLERWDMFQPGTTALCSTESYTRDHQTVSAAVRCSGQQGCVSLQSQNCSQSSQLVRPSFALADCICDTSTDGYSLPASTGQFCQFTR